MPYQVDVSKLEEVSSLFAGDGRGVDILVNSAGAMQNKAFDKLTSDGDHPSPHPPVSVICPADH